MKEYYVLLIYDIEDTKIRNRVYEIAKDYGLETIQYSIFMGKLSRNMREELFLRVKSEMKEKPGQVIIIPIGNDEFAKIKSHGKPLSMFQFDFVDFV